MVVKIQMEKMLGTADKIYIDNISKVSQGSTSPYPSEYHYSAAVYYAAVIASPLYFCTGSPILTPII